MKERTSDNDNDNDDCFGHDYDYEDDHKGGKHKAQNTKHKAQTV